MKEEDIGQMTNVFSQLGGTPPPVLVSFFLSPQHGNYLWPSTFTPPTPNSIKGIHVSGAFIIGTYKLPRLSQEENEI